MIDNGVGVGSREKWSWTMNISTLRDYITGSSQVGVFHAILLNMVEIVL